MNNARTSITTRGCRWPLLILLSLTASLSVIAAGEDPAWYQRQPTWEETIRLSREALMKAEAAEGTGKVERLSRRRDQIWTLARRDFKPDQQTEDLGMEDPCNIWLKDWPAGDYRELAGRYASACVGQLRTQAVTLAGSARSAEDLEKVRGFYRLSQRCLQLQQEFQNINTEAVQRTIEDLGRSYPDRYDSAKHRQSLDTFAKRREELLKALSDGRQESLAEAETLFAGVQTALLANPLLNFDRLLLVKRTEHQLGLPANYLGNESLPRNGYDNEIAVLSPVRPNGKIQTLYRPEGTPFVGDVRLDYDGQRMMFSSLSTNRNWRVFELKSDGTGLRQLPQINDPDVANYDACYLPDGDIIFTSTAPFTGVPCVGGSSHVANFYRLDSRTGAIRRLTFEQEHDWCPTVLNDGRLLYLRWEYSDLPHYVSRILFHMNPDGTDQKEFYGSNSYWPNAMFYAKPIPNQPTKFAAIIGGHHDVPRMGELILFDIAKGRREAGGVIQRIPGYGKKVEPVIRDGLVGGSWPKFLHPWPLSDKYFIVSSKPTPKSKWGIYLVDVFDNMLLLKESDSHALLEPIPFRETPRPPVVPVKVQPDRKDALVYLSDVYSGQGLSDVPRGTVKKLRLFTYHFAYHGMGGQVNRVGLDGPWDIKRIIGTVPVEEDGSALFRVPANTPISVQPLDSEGKALQLMRSWMTAMPGETLSCTGCHDHQNTTPSATRSAALARQPAEITPWYGPTRGFSFVREVQPVLDKYCAGCHNGQPQADGKTLVDFRNAPPIHPKAANASYNNGTQFSPSYIALRSYVRNATIESDMNLLTPCEFHADTTDLVRMLKHGHHGVQLDTEAWDRIVTWIDLNTPAHGTWHEIVGEQKTNHQRDRRRDMQKQYAGIDEDPEAIPTPYQPVAFVAPQAPAEPHPSRIECAGWPFDEAEARRRQATSAPAEQQIDLGDGIKLDMAYIPAGEFVMGSATGESDEQPASKIRIEKPFWMGRCEISNEQFARFDSTHDSRIEVGDFLQFGERERGYPVNQPKQPVVRVSWSQAMDFCRWLSARTGKRFILPTEAQWEYACRAGAATPLWFGGLDTNFARVANLADSNYRRVDTFGWGLPSGAVPPWRPAVEIVNDNYKVSAPIGTTQPNPWGLCDMHGNAAEWTLSTYRPYPYREDDGRNAGNSDGMKTVRGGAWSDLPKHATASCRLGVPAWRSVFNTGFRVIYEPTGTQ